MAEIYLYHPKHGVKIATMEMEAQYDETNGWVRFDPDDVLDEVASDALPEPLVEDNVLAEPRRRGRPRVAKSE